ncbi:MAG TPA: sugar ABC transporter substrate-binding protein [Chloroflexota bacterium]|nr:sugar ABC transporter substrate-binding protein [Chloroflexota bacterium]
MQTQARNGLTRRGLLASTGAMGLSAVTAACAAPGSSSTANPQAGGPGGKQVTIRYAMWGDNALIDRERTELVAQFEAKHPNIKVDPEVSAFATYWERMQAEAAGGTAPDVIWMSVAYSWDYAHRKFVLNLQPLINKEIKKEDYFYNVSVNTLRYPREDQGDLYAFPHRWVCSALFYNKKLFDAAGQKYPSDEWTYDDVLAAAKRLTRDTADPKTGVWGFYSHSGHTFLDALINSHGGEVLTKDYAKAMLDQPKALQGIEWAVNTITRDRVAPDAAAQTDLTQPGPGVFPSGRVAMFIDGSYNMQRFKDLDFDWDVALGPKGPQKRVIYGGPDSYSITSGTKLKDQAWAFMKFAIGPNRPMESYPLGTVPIYKPMAFSAEWLKRASTPATRYKTAVLGAEPYVKGADFSSQWIEWRTKTMNTELAPAFRGEKSVVEAARSATQQINQILAQK